MLQVTRRILFALSIAACLWPAAALAASGQGEPAPDVGWLFDDALREDQIKLNPNSVVMPQDYRRAIDLYNKGSYQLALHVLENLRDLNLPDGRLDFIHFALGECYRQCRLRDFAVESYRTVVRRFPASDKVAPSYFRLLQYACSERDTLQADTISSLFQLRFRSSPLLNSVLYITGRLRWTQERYDDAIAFLSQVSPASSSYLQAQFLSALCYMGKKQWEKAILILGYVRKNSSAPAVAGEARILLADIYFNKGQFATALELYKSVPRSAKRYYYSLVKMSRVYLEMGQYAKARDLAKNFIIKNKANEYFFEMVSILEQAYAKLNDKANAERMQGLIFQQLKTARLSFEIYDELSRVSDMIRMWQVIEFKAIQQGNEALLAASRQNIEKLKAMGQSYRGLLLDIGIITVQKGDEGIPGLAERRYLDIITDKSEKTRDTVKVAVKILDSLKNNLVVKPSDSVSAALIAKMTPGFDSLKERYNAGVREQQLVLKECLGGIQGMRQADENLQAKFVDWAFLRYQDKKIELAKMNKEFLEASHAKAKKDTLQPKAAEAAAPKKDTLQPKAVEAVKAKKDTLQSKAAAAASAAKAKKDKQQPKAVEAKKDTLQQNSTEVTKAFSAQDIDKLQRSIVEDRTMLVNHITSMQYVYPQSKYIPQLLFRLAEIYFDQASDDFDVKLRAYEKKLAEGKDTAHLVFPEYDLKKVIDTYDYLVRMYPADPLAPAALFYKALSLQKLNEYDKANDALLELTEKYPESEYYVEANMNIARYYFEHPKIQGGKGYKLAEETYHKVLYYRDHPQFVSALYSLGWCYYMEDQYDEAIAVFKYLVEEVALDFDVTKLDEKKQVSNPLLRDEAIDYIAISFDEESRIDDAVKFLQLIGNVDYAALVLKRIADLRVEDMDYRTAVRVYKRLIAEYPQSIAAPDASLSLIKAYELLNLPDSAMRERENFFTTYSKGGQWQDLVWKRDSLLIPRVDSIAVTMGLYISDANYRNADARKDQAGYAAAAKFYGGLVQKYPTDKRASEALWNLAVLLDAKLDKSADAYAQYLAFSRNKSADAKRREQAAQNAVAIAQKMLPSDTAAEEGKLDSAALRVIEAVNNYKELFPTGPSLYSVLLTGASVYFNRKMYANAAEFYEAIVKTGVTNENFYEALFLLGQCHFGKENWDLAAQAYEKVWKGSGDAARKSKAYKLLLQSLFSSANQAFASGAFSKAASAFAAIDQNYPGSEYGDAVLFKAAESYEKTEDWIKACDSYYRLKNNYPTSKLAPSALFNAATDYEKANKFDKAAEAYELLVASYLYSDKAKDALFNLGLCYEKLGKLDKMAEANERYTQQFPGEKDVEAMLLRSAQYYYKANMFDKAINAYRNFIRRYTQSPKVIEALFMIGKMSLEKQDKEMAVLSFSQAEQLNARLATANVERNDYFASEAAYYLANMKRDEFAAVKFVQPDAKFKADQKLKTQLLQEATKAYEKVIQYRSERLFEAAYRIGGMYEDFVETWKNQERPKLPPVKLAVLEKDIAQAAAVLIQKSFAPYKKVIEIGAGFDSLNAEQKLWVYKAKVSLAKNMLAAGQYLCDAYLAMQNAPIPPEIKDKPLYYYQYLKQVLDAVAPMKAQARAFYLLSVKQLDSMGLQGENSAKCLEAFHQTNYLTGSEYDKLAEKILKEPEIPATLSAQEKEDLSFQLEDVVYELQDKAIASYEEALAVLKKENMQSSEWYGRIMLGLARLSPEKYGKAVFKRVVVAASKEWAVRGDSVPGWRSSNIPLEGWKQAAEIPGLSSNTAGMTVPYIWHPDTSARNLYSWQHVFLPGQPRDAMFHIRVSGKYWLYINGTLTASDTVGKRSPQKLDSISGIQSLVKGGDNDISIHVTNVDSTFKGFSVVFSALLDTSQHFKEAGKFPFKQQAPETAAPAPAPGDTSHQKGATQAHEKKAGAVAASQEKKTAPSSAGIKDTAGAVKYKTSKDVMKAVVEYQKKTELLNAEIKKERLEVQKLIIKNEDLDSQIKKVKEETGHLEKKPEGTGKSK
ncbi:MAG TPA: tetratricopeptide repeat protein [Chitinivibrionales bacterium]|nr:tetratricopeptide repeat protein [Chitinivibrionales bacterium]